MCDQSKSLATSFMCGKDLDNYLKNPNYAGPFTHGTRMLNKYRLKGTNPCIDHYENLQFEGCCLAAKLCQQKKNSSCNHQRQQSKPNCCGNHYSPSSLSSSSCSSSSDSDEMPCSGCSPPKKTCCCPPPCCPRPCCQHIKYAKCCNNNDDDDNVEDDPITKRCKLLYNRGRTLLTQIELTKLPYIVVEDDDYMPSIYGCGWQIAIKPKILGKSKFQVKAYDPYLMLHSWEAMQGICNDDKNLRGGHDKSNENNENDVIESGSETDGITDGDKTEEENEQVME